jgi:hypothetical protein
MGRYRYEAVGLLIVTVASVSLHAVPPPPIKPSDKSADSAHDAQALATRIDQLIAERWSSRGIVPAPPADDSEFLRRVSLDLGGKIPRVWEVREFLNHPRPDKRERLVARLLDGPDYARHFTDFWRALFVPDSGEEQSRFLLPRFEAWLRQRLQDNIGYDRLVRDLLILPLATPRNQNVFFRINQGQPTPLAFYAANELKPENLGASTSRLFLGVKLECAQCHDHPFAKWSRKQFWQYAAFFSGLKAQSGIYGPVEDKADRREIQITGTNKTVQARMLDGTQPAWKPGVSARVTLAEWITNPDNPFFARAAVNRIWAQFFGIGLIEPVDEPSDQNPASHPELLDELAHQFAAHQFDLKFLIRAITTSRTYQSSSVGASSSPEERRLFSRMSVKGLSPEQLFDSLAQATGYRDFGRGNQPGFFGVVEPSPRREFLTRFASQDKRTQPQTSILQALLLMNGKFVADATSVDKSELLAAVIDAPFLGEPTERIETCYLATLSRKPRPDELARLLQYMQRKETKAALADVYWSLLNSSEFMLNH